MKRTTAISAVSCLLLAVVISLCARPALAQETVSIQPSVTPWTDLTLALLLPAGFALLAAAGQPADRAWDMALSALLALGLSAVAYFVCGFAFQFGGLGLWHANPVYGSLNLHWSALGPTSGRGWGMLGLTGFFLRGGAATPSAYRLFLAQLPLVATATMLPLVGLRRRAPAAVSLLAGLLMACACYPLLGNWVWGGGWLARLGDTLGLGHGFVDMGGAGAVHLAGATMALIGLLLFVPRRTRHRLGEAPILVPQAHLSMLGVLGALLLVACFLAALLAQPWPDWTALSVEVIGMNVTLAAAAGALMPGLYTWFTGGRPDPILVSRGVAAALVGVCAAAPFIEPEMSLMVGATAGALTPLLTYWAMERAGLDDAGGVVVTHGLGGLIGCLAPALFASGRFGQGWNGVGGESYLGVASQGVTGVWAAIGQQPDWPGQTIAQLAGIGASILLPGLLSLALFSGFRVIVRLRSAGESVPVAGSVSEPRTEPDSAPSTRETETSSTTETQKP